MKHLAAFFTIGLTFVAFLASAEDPTGSRNLLFR